MPDRGTCPECGQDYDVKHHLGIRVPDSPTERSQRIYARARTITLTVLGIAFLLIACIAQFAFDFKLALYTVGFAGIMMLLFAGMSYMSENED